MKESEVEKENIESEKHHKVLSFADVFLFRKIFF